MRRTAIWPAMALRPGRWINSRLVDHVPYRRGTKQGRKVFTLQTCRRVTSHSMRVGKVAGFSYMPAWQRERSTPEARTAVSLHQPAGHLGKASVAHPERQRSVPAEDAFTGDGTTHVIFEPLDFIARLAAWCRNHGQPGAVSTASLRQTANTGRVTPAKRGRAVSTPGPRIGGAYVGRTPCRDDLGAAPQAGVRDRHRDLPACGGAMRIIACIRIPTSSIRSSHLDAKMAEPEGLRRPPCRRHRKRVCSTDQSMTTSLTAASSIDAVGFARPVG